MNYRHNYHAGSFADVLKHVVLVGIFQSLLKKDKGFCYIDTHAGIGRYDLSSKEAQKTKESETGILSLLKNKASAPPLVKKYLQTMRAINAQDTWRFYPGSPRIARHFLREQDKMILTELHSEDFKILKLEFSGDKQVAVHHLDGYQALKAFLPPMPRRGLVLIDPPYEASNEFETVIKNVTQALVRWQEGIFALWYPIKNPYQILQFHRSLRQKITNPILVIELNVYPSDSPLSLNGSGMLIINPPWQLEQTLKDALPFVGQALDTQGQGDYRIHKLK